ncbi:MAG: bifunctional aspartate transaminase/aspartate 4-decarboxylase [Betaproteobacteria bacterium]
MGDTATVTRRALAGLSPFELKDWLLAQARLVARRDGTPVLDAGRGNPDWLAPAAREAFFLLGEFACLRAELGTVLSPDPGGEDLATFLAGRAHGPGGRLLRDGLAWAQAGPVGERFLVELVRGVLGAAYPDPPAILPGVGAVCRAYLAALYGWPEDVARDVRLLATEGASAGVSCLFPALFVNGLLRRGDHVAVVAPVFTPYLEILRSPRYGFRIVPLQLDPGRAGQLPPREVDRLADAAIRALVVVNPGNPVATSLDSDTVEHIASIVETVRKDLLIVSDDVYGPLAPGYASLSGRLPAQTIGVFSFSKFFGATGWRLGLISLAAGHVADRALATLPAARRAALARRYRPLAADPGSLDFFRRLTAETRDPAFHHTSGLSTPQQVQMALFALGSLLDAGDRWGADLRGRLAARRAALWSGLALPAPPVPGHTGYYELLDLATLAAHWGVEPVAVARLRRGGAMDAVCRLAAAHGVVVLPGAGFGAPVSTVRVALANLDADGLVQVGQAIRAVIAGARGGVSP